MQPTPGRGSDASSAGGGELNRGVLHRFRSAPATWLEALLEGDEEDPLKPSQTLTQLLVDSPNSRNPAAFASSSVEPGLFEPAAAGFQRQNSSPADFLGNSGSESDDYFSSFGVPSNFEYVSSSIDVSPSGKRGREMELQNPSAKFSPQLKGEQSGQVPGGGSGLIDMEMEKILEDSAPFKVRAKRGCATHPRSIAERVRRTKISDRIRKLQELVPNMDKQTNTADMLEEAVEYVKFLRKQIEELTEQQGKCQCMAKDQ